MRRTRMLVGALVLFGGAACGDGGLEPLPLNITIEVSPATAATGELLSFVVNAQGGTLVGVAVDYGDGIIDQFPVHSARTARVTFQHAYSATGTYQVEATVLDAVAGSKDAAIEVRVQ